MPEGSISDHLHAGRSFSEHESKQILAQATDALAYLHSQDPQIVHRDVKPSNILTLNRRPGDLFIKFAEFGLSREGDQRCRQINQSTLDFRLDLIEMFGCRI